MNRVIKLLTVFLILAFLFFPIFNDFSPQIRNTTPHGVFPAKPYFEYSLDHYFKGKWQRRVTERAKKNSGLWDPFLRISNELMYNFFSQMGLYQNASLFLGKDGYMIQNTHLSEFNRENNYSLDKVYMQLEKLKRVQDLQRKRGKSVILIITPTIASLYPELIPDNYIDPTSITRVSHYELIKEKIKSLDLLHVNAQELLNDKKNNYSFKLFAKTAAHWNDVGSCLALSEASKLLKSKNLPNLGNIDCDKFTLQDKPQPKDLDLLDLANMMFPENYYEATPYIDSQNPLADLKKASKPVVQLVGTSYLIAFYKHLKDWDLTNGIVQYFYFRSYRTEANRKFRTLDKSKLNWNEILNRDILIVNIGMSNLSGLGNGFIEAAEKHLSQGGIPLGK